MKNSLERRDFLRLLGAGGWVFASGLPGCAERAGEYPSETPSTNRQAKPPARDFFFLQMSDTHVGFEGPPNPDAALTLPHAIELVNASAQKPDFIVFTGDLTHTTDDRAMRRERMKRFHDHVAKLDVKNIRFLPGEHDASLDRGEAYQEHFGDLHYAFDHEGVHFIALDNVSDPAGAIGDAQLDWLAKEVNALQKGTPLVVLAHRPLFDLFPAWDWATKDGARAIEILSKHDAVSVFYGHIHQEHHVTTGAISHHAARSLVFPLPPPGSQPKRAPLAWDPTSKDHGLGYRRVFGSGKSEDVPYAAPLASGAPKSERVVKVRARKFAFEPDLVRAKVGEAIVFEIASDDTKHGFFLPDFNARADVASGKPARVRIVANAAGTFRFHCDVFCGDGHEGMEGVLVVEA